MGAEIDLDLIFVHIPKSGGTSIVSRLRDHYGAALLASNADRPLDPLGLAHRDRAAFLAMDHTSALVGRKAVTGHMWVRKYKDVPARTRAVILRDPVERLVSQYFYWPASKKGKPVEHSILRRLLDEKPSVEEFATWRPLRYTYTESFFLDVDMSSFDYIGDYRDLRSHWDRIMARLGVSGAPVVMNQTQEVVPDYADQKQQVLADTRLMARLRDILRDDLAFYERWARPI